MAPRPPPLRSPYLSRPVGESGHEASFRPFDPGIEISERLSANDALELDDDLAGFDEERDAALDRRPSAAVIANWFCSPAKTTGLLLARVRHADDAERLCLWRKRQRSIERQR
jgi:hypothetical protein